MKDLYKYICEALPLSLAREYLNISRDKKAQKYMDAFWNELKSWAQSHGGNVSRNGYRIYIPYKGPAPKITADDDGTSGSSNQWTTNREAIKSIVAMALEERGQYIFDWNYIEGTVDVGMKDQNGNVKVRKGQKIGKIISKDTIPTPKGNVSALDIFNADPIRLGKSIKSSISGGDLWLCISNHAYDIAGMSTNRDWTSCMNIIDGSAKLHVEEDIRLGTLVVYLIDKKDTNIEHPYGRVLIKPYKLQRPGFSGFKPCDIIYSPEVTVYSPYVGLKPVREWIKDICEEIQEGEGMLRAIKGLYMDTYHDDPDREFHGKPRK